MTTEDDQDQGLEVLLPPREAARRLGVAASTLRRLGPIYEAVYGALPWTGGDAGAGRLWPDRAVERLGAARALVSEGRAKSLDDALRALRGGAQPPSAPLARVDDAAAVAELAAGLKAALEALQGELREVSVLKAELAEIPALRSEIAQLRAELRAQDRPPLLGRPIAFGDADVPPSISAGAVAAPDQGSRIDQTAEDGLAVRAARWLERLIRRGSR